MKVLIVIAVALVLAAAIVVPLYIIARRAAAGKSVKRPLYAHIASFFGIFALSDFGGTVALGVLVSITLLAAMFSNIFILPSLLLTLDKHTTNKQFKRPPIKYLEEEQG